MIVSQPCIGTMSRFPKIVHPTSSGKFPVFAETTTGESYSRISGNGTEIIYEEWTHTEQNHVSRERFLNGFPQKFTYEMSRYNVFQF